VAKDGNVTPKADKGLFNRLLRAMATGGLPKEPKAEPKRKKAAKDGKPKKAAKRPS